MNGAGRDEGPTVAAVAPQKSTKTENRDCRAASFAGQALRAIEGEAMASHYLARLCSQRAEPDELTVIVSALDSATLRGFCRAIEKALRVRRTTP